VPIIDLNSSSHLHGSFFKACKLVGASSVQFYIAASILAGLVIRWDLEGSSCQFCYCSAVLYVLLAIAQQCQQDAMHKHTLLHCRAAVAPDHHGWWLQGQLSGSMMIMITITLHHAT
jgi:hypothetical protein